MTGAIGGLSDLDAYQQAKQGHISPDRMYDPDWLNRIPWDNASPEVASKVKNDILKIDAINTLSKPQNFLDDGETGYASRIRRATSGRLGFDREVNPPVKGVGTYIPNLPITLDTEDANINAHTHPTKVDLGKGKVTDVANAPKYPSFLDYSTAGTRQVVNKMLDQAPDSKEDLIYTKEYGKPAAYLYSKDKSESGPKGLGAKLNAGLRILDESVQVSQADNKILNGTSTAAKDALLDRAAQQEYFNTTDTIPFKVKRLGSPIPDTLPEHDTSLKPLALATGTLAAKGIVANRAVASVKKRFAKPKPPTPIQTPLG